MSLAWQLDAWERLLARDTKKYGFGVRWVRTPGDQFLCFLDTGSHHKGEGSTPSEALLRALAVAFAEYEAKKVGNGNHWLVRLKEEPPV